MLPIAQTLASYWPLIALCLIPSVYWYSTRNFDYWKKRGIPGPPNIPFWGSAFSFRIPVSHLYVDYVKKYGKCFGVFQGHTPHLVIVDPVIVKRILVQDFHIFRNRPDFVATSRKFNKGLVMIKDEEWKRIRSMLSPLFTTLKLKKMEDLMQGCVDSLLTSLGKKAKSRETFEAREPMSNFTMDVIARCAFATETNAHSEKDNTLLKNAKAIFEFSMAQLAAIILLPRRLQLWLIDNRLWPLFQPESDFFASLIHRLIQERRTPEARSAHHDMLQLMVNAEHSTEQLKETFKIEADAHHVNTGAEELAKEEKELKDIIGSKFLSEEEIMSQSFLFLLAGYETTASTLSHCLFEMGANPDIQERLYQEIQEAKRRDPNLTYSTLNELPYLDAVISETLRKYPPSHLLRRISSEKYYIPELGLTLEPGTEVNIPGYAMHHLEEHFPEPERFNPDRFMPENRANIQPYTYIPFGGGPRNCIGMRFALTEARMGLARLLDGFEIMRVPGISTDKLTILQGQLLKTSSINLSVRKRVK